MNIITKTVLSYAAKDERISSELGRMLGWRLYVDRPEMSYVIWLSSKQVIYSTANGEAMDFKLQ